ncbi:heterokaryon incompatibility protein-domain-containing protein [Phascolomyces articulosus]|uniref:Heterokaryon incompatibility protein-domain-containing protein n=1 Tax=Phascolomyces articulosus TaxID=60185 RepID=A0AAD5PJ45_9FUNG|nr:heterokaryon incompatibility protein-domain-containing protein [Phascolomyces articulosus]
MQVVPGIEAVYGYCAFSYSWNYSGDIIIEGVGKSRCDDKGLHEIVTHRWNEKQQTYTKATFTVKFEKVIQQICKDFGIDYIWYDKLCIDQDDPVKRINEIKQMHNIYRNALFTVVLIPELKPEMNKKDNNSRIQQDPFDGYCLEAIVQSEWCTRMWTLEESILSRSMVFVGETIHFWSHQLGDDLFYYGRSKIHKTYYPIILELCFDNRVDASKVLHFAHRRTSTKVHDKVYALGNIFTNILKTMGINYSRDLPEVLLQFYGRLAEEDITILYFGKPVIEYPSTMDEFKFLPSWTGISGMHVLEVGLKYLQKTSISSASTEQQSQLQVEETERIFSLTVMNNTSLVINCGSTTTVPRTIQKLLDNDDDNETKKTSIEYLEYFFGLKITHYVSVMPPKQQGMNNNRENAKLIQQQPLQKEDYHPEAFLSLTEDCLMEECQVLNIPFNVYTRHGIFHPVIRWNEQQQSYKAIGIFIIHISNPFQSIRVPLDKFGILKVGEFKIQ